MYVRSSLIVFILAVGVGCQSAPGSKKPKEKSSMLSMMENVSKMMPGLMKSLKNNPFFNKFTSQAQNTKSSNLPKGKQSPKQTAMSEMLAEMSKYMPKRTTKSPITKSPLKVPGQIPRTMTSRPEKKPKVVNTVTVAPTKPDIKPVTEPNQILPPLSQDNTLNLQATRDYMMFDALFGGTQGGTSKKSSADPMLTAFMLQDVMHQNQAGLGQTNNMGFNNFFAPTTPPSTNDFATFAILDGGMGMGFMDGMMF